KKYNMIVLISEFIVPMRAVYNLSNAIYDFAKKKKVKQIISLGAIVQKGKDPKKVFAVASDLQLLKKLEKHKKIELVKEGVTTGVTGVLLARGAIEKFPVISLLAQATADYMDPRASASVLEVLKDHLNLKSLDVKALEKEAHEVEAKMKELISKAKANQEHYNKTAKDSVSDFDTMYG
ncbi:MAG: PAC2 family protein, partial [Candidatus Micrarchaeota archaeon]